MTHISDRISEGEATWKDVELLHEVAGQIKGKCLCALGEFAIEAVISSIERFEPDFKVKVKAD
jgi:NADH-quinone oxidoreductase subunit F